MSQSNQGEARSDQLSGWKEIAAYVGKGVRQAQRWEKLGMPIHRVQGLDGVVYALRSEIDRWRATAPEGVSFEKPDLSAEQASKPEVHEVQPLTPHRSERRVRLSISAVAAVVAFIAIALFLNSRQRDTHVTKVRIRGQVLEALADSGAVVWTFGLGFNGTMVQGGEEETRPQPLLKDLDGDGTEEVLVAVRHGGNSEAQSSSDRLYCFSQEGSMRWVYSLPEFPYTFGGKRFQGPTRFLAWAADNEGRVWISINHHTWWPTIVQQIDRNGVAKTQYVQAGGVYSLRAWRTRGRTLLLAGGVNNEYGLASVAVIDTTAGAASFPQTRGSAFECDDCPKGRPVRFSLLPRSDVNRASLHSPYGIVVRLEPRGDGIRATSHEGGSAVLYHELGPDLILRSEPAADSYGQTHRHFEAAGRIGHPFERCPLRAGGPNSFDWTPDGWVTSPPQSSVMASADSSF